MRRSQWGSNVGERSRGGRGGEKSSNTLGPDQVYMKSRGSLCGWSRRKGGLVGGKVRSSSGTRCARVSSAMVRI